MAGGHVWQGPMPDLSHALCLSCPVQNNDATFDKFARLSEGIKYVDPLKAKLQDDAER